MVGVLERLFARMANQGTACPGPPGDVPFGAEKHLSQIL